MTLEAAWFNRSGRGFKQGEWDMPQGVQREMRAIGLMSGTGKPSAFHPARGARHRSGQRPDQLAQPTSPSGRG